MGMWGGVRANLAEEDIIEKMDENASSWKQLLMSYIMCITSSSLLLTHDVIAVASTSPSVACFSLLARKT